MRSPDGSTATLYGRFAAAGRDLFHQFEAAVIGAQKAVISYCEQPPVRRERRAIAVVAVVLVLGDHPPGCDLDHPEAFAAPERRREMAADGREGEVV